MTKAQRETLRDIKHVNTFLRERERERMRQMRRMRVIRSRSLLEKLAVLLFRVY